jgi:hypothetical protein
MLGRAATVARRLPSLCARAFGSADSKYVISSEFEDIATAPFSMRFPEFTMQQFGQFGTAQAFVDG